MSTVALPFYAAVALAGAAFLVVHAAASRSDLLRDILPVPILAGLLVALAILLVRGFGWNLELPHQGTSVDFLVALLTTNMGLHITPRVLKTGLPAFGIFLLGGVLLFGLQLLAVLPFALADPHTLETAILTGPLSFLGAPYNLNPPAQVPPVAELLSPPFSNPEASAQGMMMLGVFAGPLVASYCARRFFAQSGAEAPSLPAREKETPQISISAFAMRETTLLVAILVLIAAAFGFQALLQAWFPTLTDDHLPVIVISYFLGAATRLGWEALFGDGRFPESALTALLVGPTMAIVLTYAVMTVPLHTLSELSPGILAAGVAAILSSALAGILLLPVLTRLVGGYYGAVIATVFVAVTTAWGPVAMSFLRRSTDQSGEVEPMPVVLPLCAFYLFPWIAILLTELSFSLLR